MNANETMFILNWLVGEISKPKLLRKTKVTTKNLNSVINKRKRELRTLTEGHFLILKNLKDSTT